MASPYQGAGDFRHDQRDRVAVLLTNLGTPAAPTTGAVRRYLREFLSDPRVVDIPRAIWLPILYGIILNVRPARSAKLYQSIWTDEGSPLLLHTQAQSDALAARFQANAADGAVDVAFYTAMRYGEPGIASAMAQIREAGIGKLLVLPLYPQYSGATTGSTFDAISTALRKTRWVPELRFVGSYHDDPAYIAACAAQIEAHWQQHGRADTLLLSYHGLPRAWLDRGDPYYCHCQKTSRLIAERLGLGPDQLLSCFQSRFGRAQWLEPYTDATLQSLAQAGTGSVQLFCPGFAADCLETLQENALENREVFLEAGGSDFQYIPALNDAPAHIDALAGLLQRQLGDWLDAPGEDPELRKSRAQSPLLHYQSEY